MAGEIAAVVAEAGGAWLETPVPPAASADDMARFSDVFSNNPVEAKEEVMGAPKAAPPTGEHMGDAILRTLDKAGKAYKARAQEVNAIVSRDDQAIGMRDMMRIQVHMVEASLHVEMLSKFVSKGTQHIDQLTKLQ